MMNIPPNQQASGNITMNHIPQGTNSQMPEGQQQRNIQQSQQQQPTQASQALQMPQQAHQQAQQVQQRLDEDLHTVIPKLYAKVKSLVPPLRETLTSLIKIAALAVQQKSAMDAGSLNNMESFDKRFNKTLEEFYTICDQIEYYLKTLIEIQAQSSSSQRYMPLPVITPRTEKAFVQKTALTYTQFLVVIKNQISYANEVHDALMSVAQSLALGQ